MFTSMAAVALALSLAACGKSATDSSTTTGDADSVSSHKVAKSSKSFSSADKKSSSDESSTSSEANSESTSSTAKNGSSVSNASQNATSSKSNASSAASSEEVATFTASDARTVLKQHLGNQAGDKQQDASTTQTQVDAVDNLAASYNGDNTWTLSGTVNGQQVSYTVSQYGVQ